MTELSGKNWDLSLYELHRTPQEAITDKTEISISPKVTFIKQISMKIDLLFASCSRTCNLNWPVPFVWKCWLRQWLQKNAFTDSVQNASQLLLDQVLLFIGFWFSRSNYFFFQETKNVQHAGRNWCQGGHWDPIQILMLFFPKYSLIEKNMRNSKKR